MFALNTIVLFFIPLIFPSMLVYNVVLGKETQNLFNENLKFYELTLRSRLGQLKTQIPQTIYYMSMGDSNASSILYSSGPMNSSWPMSCHDLHHTSQSPYSTENNSGGEMWRFQCEGVDGGPVIANDGMIYFGDKGSPQYLYALYPNGTLKWRYHLLDIWVWSTPAIAEDGTVYVGDFEGNFYAVATNGSLRWYYTVPGLGNSIASSPAVAPDGTIYFGSMEPNGGHIYALNPDGTLKWRYPTGWITSNPAIGSDGTIYIGSSDHYLYAMNPNGTLKWRFQTGNLVKSHPSIASDGTIYFTAFDNKMYALNPDGTQKWSFNYGGSGNNAVTIASDGTLYIAGDVLYALFPNGTVRWKFTFGSNEFVDHSCPAISSDGTIYVGTNIGVGTGGNIVAVNPDGTERWRQTIANTWVDSSPAIASDGTVYIGSTSIGSSAPYGFLHAFRKGPLKVYAEGPYTGMPMVPVQFKCNVIGGELPYSYQWSFGDGSTSTTKNPSHTYSLAGSYNVTLIVTDSEGNSSSDTTTAFINSPPNTPTITGSSQGHVRHRYTYTFVTKDPEDETIEYYVDWGDGWFTNWRGPYQSGEAITLSHTYTRKGTYAIKCQARDVNGWKSDWGTLQVTMPLSYEPPHFRFLDWLLERFPHAFLILRYLMGSKS